MLGTYKSFNQHGTSLSEEVKPKSPEIKQRKAKLPEKKPAPAAAASEPLSPSPPAEKPVVDRQGNVRGSRSSRRVAKTSACEKDIRVAAAAEKLYSILGGAVRQPVNNRFPDAIRDLPAPLAAAAVGAYRSLKRRTMVFCRL